MNLKVLNKLVPKGGVRFLKKTSAPTIFLGNSFSKVSGISEEVYKTLEKALTYTDEDVYHEIQQTKKLLGISARKKQFKRVGYLKKRLRELEESLEVCWLDRGKFPTGHLKIVKEVLEKEKIAFNIEDLRIKPKSLLELPWKEKDREPRYYQKDMVEASKSAHRGVFESAVGTGKTFIMMLLIRLFRVPTLVIVPSRPLLEQTYEEFSKNFGKKWVSVVSSSTKKENRKPIQICTIQTLSSLLKKNSIKNIIEDTHLLCIDEVHHSGSQSYTNLLPHFDHIYYRFGFSGTFLRNDSKT